MNLRFLKLAAPSALLFSLFAAGSALLPTSHAPYAVEPKDSTALIGAWNLGGFHPIPDAKLVRIAQSIYWMDAEVIALSEVNPAGATKTIVQELAKLGMTYHEKTIDQAGTGQEIGFIWKERVDLENVREIAGSDLGKPQ